MTFVEEEFIKELLYHIRLSLYCGQWVYIVCVYIWFRIYYILCLFQIIWTFMYLVFFFLFSTSEMGKMFSNAAEMHFIYIFLIYIYTTKMRQTGNGGRERAENDIQ